MLLTIARRIHWLIVLLLSVAISAKESTKTFEVHKCRYTLPSNDWSWTDPSLLPNTNAICMAKNESLGLFFMLTVVPDAPATDINERFIQNFENGIAKAGGLTKRDGRSMQFKGLPCYQFEGTVAGQATAVVRVILGHGATYMLQLIGNEDAVEKRPDIEQIMNGFEFTSPPSASSPQKNRDDAGNSFARGIGVWALIAVILILVIKHFRKSAT